MIFAWNIVIYPFTFSQPMLLNLKWIFLKQYIAGLCIFYPLCQSLFFDWCTQTFKIVFNMQEHLSVPFYYFLFISFFWLWFLTFSFLVFPWDPWKHFRIPVWFIYHIFEYTFLYSFRSGCSGYYNICMWS